MLNISTNLEKKYIFNFSDTNYICLCWYNYNENSWIIFGY